MRSQQYISIKRKLITIGLISGMAALLVATRAFMVNDCYLFNSTRLAKWSSTSSVLGYSLALENLPALYIYPEGFCLSGQQ